MIVSMICCVCLMTNTSVVLASSETVISTIEDCQIVINQFNEEHNSDFFIDLEKADAVLAYVIEHQYSQEDLYCELLSTWENANNSGEANYKNEQNSFHLDTVNETITQRVSIGNNTTVKLKSNIYSTSGASGSYKYRSIISMGVEYPSGTTHIEDSSMSYTLSSDAHTCTVKLVGNLMTPAGIILLTAKTYTITFTAG